MKLKTGTHRAAGSLSRYQRFALPMIGCSAALTGAASGWLITDPAMSQLPELTSTVSVEQMDGESANLSSTQTIQETDQVVPAFNGRPVRALRTIRMMVTAYSPDAQSCGEFADGITASGYSVKTNGMKLVAADTSLLPFGTMLSIPGYDDGFVVPVLDRGGAIKGNHLDALFPTHEEALQWGVRHLDVTIWEYADGKPNDFKSIY